MVFLIEGQEYNRNDLKQIFGEESDILPQKKSNVVIEHVGYYRHFCESDDKEQTVFLLPKNFANIIKREDRKPYEVSADFQGVDEELAKVLRELPLWMLGSLCRYRNRISDTRIVDEMDGVVLQKGFDHSKAVLQFDRLISLIGYYHKHEDFVITTYQDAHRGMNKIDWGKTVRNQVPIITDRNVVYPHLCNRKKVINNDEMLMVLYFSTMEYVSNKYGIDTPKSPFYNVIDADEFKAMVEDDMILGVLMDIRDNYFSDRTVELWELLYSFFENSMDLEMEDDRSEGYLLIRNYDRVFEDMMDYLLTDNNLQAMKEQRDNKRMDHVFVGESILNKENKVFYVADSKYYSNDSDLDDISMYKQFTYVTNILQDVMDVRNGEKDKYGIKEIAENYYDKETRGFEVTPNFFVRGKICYDFDNLSFEHREKTEKIDHMVFFDDCLFDRNSLYTLTYEINLLALMKIYASEGNILPDKKRITQTVRTDLIKKIKAKFEFYKLTPTDYYKGWEKVAVNRSLPFAYGKIFKCNNEYICAIKKDDKETLPMIKKYWIEKETSLSEN